MSTAAMRAFASQRASHPPARRFHEVIGPQTARVLVHLCRACAAARRAGRRRNRAPVARRLSDRQQRRRARRLRESSSSAAPWRTSSSPMHRPAASSASATPRPSRRACLGKIEKELAASGLTMADVVKMNVFMVGDPAKGGGMDFGGLMKAYSRHFGEASKGNLPARTTVQVAALAGAGRAGRDRSRGGALNGGAPDAMPVDPAFAELLADKRSELRAPPAHVTAEVMRAGNKAYLVTAPRRRSMRSRIAWCRVPPVRSACASTGPRTPPVCRSSCSVTAVVSCSAISTRTIRSVIGSRLAADARSLRSTIDAHRNALSWRDRRLHGGAALDRGERAGARRRWRTSCALR